MFVLFCEHFNEKSALTIEILRDETCVLNVLFRFVERRCEERIFAMIFLASNYCQLSSRMLWLKFKLKTIQRNEKYKLLFGLKFSAADFFPIDWNTQIFLRTQINARLKASNRFVLFRSLNLIKLSRKKQLIITRLICFQNFKSLDTRQFYNSLMNETENFNVEISFRLTATLIYEMSFGISF